MIIMHFPFGQKMGGKRHFLTDVFSEFCYCFSNTSLSNRKKLLFGVHIDGSLILRSFTTTAFKIDEK